MMDYDIEDLKKRLISYLNTLYGFVWNVKVKTLKSIDEKIIAEGTFDESFLGPVRTFKAEMEKRYPYKLIDLKIE
jgi:hypothetical protein